MRRVRVLGLAVLCGCKLGSFDQGYAMDADTDTAGELPTGGWDPDDDDDGSADDDDEFTTGDDEWTDGGESSSGGEIDGDERDAINEYIAGLALPEVAEEGIDEGEPSAPYETGNYMCTSRHPTETKRFDRIVAFAANSGQMWPGAVIGGESIAHGLFTPKILDRAPLTFSASLEGVISGDVSATIEEPSLSAFREAMSEIIQQTLTGQTPANIFSQIEEVYSKEQVSFALGLNVHWMAGGIESSFGFDDLTTRSRFVVNFTQSYYTVDIDPPGSAADWFDPTVTLEDVQDEMRGEPPAYVSSVTYGRMVYFVVTSELESSQVRAALEYGFGGLATVDGSVSLTHEEVLSETEITAYILGGEGEAAAQAVHGIDELRDYINSGGTWTKESPGAPISYKLAYLDNDSPARYALATDYEVEECDRISQDVRVAVQNIHVVSSGDDNGTELEIFGNIAVEDGDGEMHPLWSRDSNNWVTIGTGQSWPVSGELASAIVPVTPASGHEIVLWVDLEESDSIWGNESLGEQVHVRQFEDGWRANFAVSAANAAQHVEVNFDLVPVG